MNTSVIKKIDTQKKIDIIFSYLFSDDKSIQEEFFWNSLKNKEVDNLAFIDNSDSVSDFSNLKSDILGK